MVRVNIFSGDKYFALGKPYNTFRGLYFIELLPVLSGRRTPGILAFDVFRREDGRLDFIMPAYTTSHPLPAVLYGENGVLLVHFYLFTKITCKGGGVCVRYVNEQAFFNLDNGTLIFAGFYREKEIGGGSYESRELVKVNLPINQSVIDNNIVVGNPGKNITVELREI